MLPLQSARIDSPEFDTPEADRFAADSDASLSQKVFNITVAEIEAIVEPDSVTDDVGWESVALISIHAATLSISPG